MTLDCEEALHPPFCSYFNSTGVKRAGGEIFSDCPKDNLDKPGRREFTTLFLVVDTLGSGDFMLWHYKSRFGVKWGFEHLEDGRMVRFSPREIDSDVNLKIWNVVREMYKVPSFTWEPASNC